MQALEEGAASSGNVLALAAEAAKQRATVGEMSGAMQKVFGRTSRRALDAAPGSWSPKWDKTAVIEEPRFFFPVELVSNLVFCEKVIASGFADLGFDVDVGPLLATPAEVRQQALDCDVHVIGVSSLRS